MFLTAGEIVGTVQHMPWEKFLRKRVLDPIGMTGTNISIKDLAKSSDHALGYDYDSLGQFVLRPYHDIDCCAPAGAINSSANEMAKWVTLMLNGGVVGGKRLLSAKSFAELSKSRINITPDIGYTLGWFQRKWRGHLVLEHGGNIDGFNAEVALLPDQKLGFVMLTNISNSSLTQQALEPT